MIPALISPLVFFAVLMFAKYDWIWESVTLAGRYFLMFGFMLLLQTAPAIVVPMAVRKKRKRERKKQTKIKSRESRVWNSRDRDDSCRLTSAKFGPKSQESNDSGQILMRYRSLRSNSLSTWTRDGVEEIGRRQFSRLSTQIDSFSTHTSNDRACPSYIHQELSNDKIR